jgi:hypothetical protein
MKLIHHGCLALSLFLAGTVAAAMQPPRVNPDAKLLAEFKERVETYVELRDRLQPKDARLKETAEPAEIEAAETALAARIRAARAGARPGDIFTPATRAKFRRLLNPEVEGHEGRETQAAIKDDNPGKIPFKVNGPYPKDKPLSTMPPNVLAALPELPDDLEYRFIEKHLILRDVRANLIVDYMLNAIP